MNASYITVFENHSKAAYALRLKKVQALANQNPDCAVEIHQQGTATEITLYSRLDPSELGMPEVDIRDLATPSSFNTPMGLTKVIRTQLEPHHQVFIAEMGARHRHDIRQLCRLVRPQIGVLTAVGPQHLETFGSVERVRTDLSATLFFSDPDEYDGGELVIEDTYGSQRVKLPAGDLVLYPSTSIHKVEPVTRGARFASFFWTQSLVREDAQRALLFEMDQAIQNLTRDVPDHPALIRLTGSYHNLLRRWVEV